MAACRTIDPDRPVHSLHGYFLRPGDGRQPVIYDVERTRDGGAFTTRRVTARQKGEAIFHMECSFHRDEPALFEHQVDPPPGLPGPDDLPNLVQLAARYEGQAGADAAARLGAFRHIELRPLDPQSWLEGRGGLAARGGWIRLLPSLGDDPVLQACALAYLSDFCLAGAAAAGASYSEIAAVARVASIDHGMWFHRPGRADDWLLYDTDSPSAQGGRGFARGQLFNRSGVLVASTCQEALFRRKAPA